jgi:hypothetical protein
MRVQDFLIGMMVFSAFIVVMFGSSNLLNEEFNVNISDEYSYDFLNKDTELRELTTEIGENSPGGSEGSVGNVDDEGADAGLQATALIYKSPGIFKSVVVGDSNTNSSSLGDKLGVPKMWGWLAFSAFALIVAIILLSSFLRNRL